MPADIFRTREAVRSLAQKTDSILVGFSGGKDSCATLDLCCAKFKRVEAFFMYLVDGLRCVEEPIFRLAMRYGVIVHKLPHWDLPRYVRNGDGMPWIIGTENLREGRLTDIEQMAREKSGIDWIAYGQRSDESLERRAMLNKLKTSGFADPKTRRFYPLTEWSAKDVFAYLRIRRIVPAPPLGARRLVQSTGIDLERETLQAMRDQFPDDFAKLCRVFPFAEAKIRQREMFPEDANADDVRDESSSLEVQT